MDRTWIPEHIPLDKPSAARMYDYYLGGAHNFEVDRQMAERAIAIYPEFPLIMRTNRAFLRRAVRFLVTQGIDQFLDLGSGIPTVGNVHEIAQATNPAVRVLYADLDPIAVAHSAALLQSNPLAGVIQADIRQPELTLQRAREQGVLNFDRPIAILLAFVLHFVTEDEVADQIVATLRSVMTPGSFLVISQSTGDGPSREKHDSLIRLYNKSSNPVVSRSPAFVARWLAGLEIVEPGIVRTPLWRPESPQDLYLDHPERASSCAAIGRVPGSATPSTGRAD
jgi:S-adenosyl methyltransferase